MVQSSVVTLSLLCLCGSFESYNISKIHHIGYELIFSYIIVFFGKVGTNTYKQ